MTPHTRVCFIASAHPFPFEPRIFHREARTLAEAGYDVTLIVGHDRTEVVDGVRVIGLCVPRRRLWRATVHSWRAFRLALRTRAQVYHFHNPEFIPFALLLRAAGKWVIYDAHEAYRDKLATREYLPRPLRRLVGLGVALLERLGARCFSHVIAADRYVAAQFRPGDVTVIANYPILAMVRSATEGLPPRVESGRTVAVYIGDLSRERGVMQMLQAMERLQGLDIELRLLGRWERAEDEHLAASVPGVRYLGFVPLAQVFRELWVAHVGLVVLQPVPAYRYAGENTNKLFEYMAAGLAVIGSGFDNLRPFIEGAGTGLCVAPESPDAIADALRRLHERPTERAAMGARGRAAVEATWNWETEGRKLLALYARLLAGREAGS